VTRSTDGAADPVARAHAAYAAGHEVFAVQLDIGHPDTEPTLTDTLNAVCAQGWELLSGSAVSIDVGVQGVGSVTVDGSKIRTSSMPLGYYLFRRRPG
jgi:glutamate/tyrosine decarboxylase-like PLP-dependent enzyme